MLIARRSPAGMRDSIEGGNAMPAGPRASSTRLCRSEEHTSELQSLMRTSYAVFCLKKKRQDRKTSTEEIQGTQLSHRRLSSTPGRQLRPETEQRRRQAIRS